MELIELYRQMALIRVFEETLLELFSAGKLVGTTHTYLGQEADAVGVIHELRPTDIIFSNHRCHGHYLAFTDDVDGLMAEIMGKANGVCGGYGGSQHLCAGNFFTNGIQGGMVPNAAGVALAEKRLGRDAVTTVFIGDGTLGQGIVYESMNIAALWRLPLFFVIEDNAYAQTTPSSVGIAGSIAARARAFGIETSELASTDVEEISEAATRIIATVRRGQPACLVLHTYRFGPHSKGDDFRDPAEIDEHKRRDPLRMTGQKIGEAERRQIEAACRERVQAAITKADIAPYPVWEETIDTDALCSAIE